MWGKNEGLGKNGQFRDMDDIGHKMQNENKNKNTTQKTEKKWATQTLQKKPKKRDCIQVFTKGKHFLFLIRHTCCS